MNMKYRFMISALSALLLLSSCQNGKEDTPGLKLSEMKVFADYEDFSWNEGTAISVFDGSANHRYVAASSGNTSEFTSDALLDDSAKDLYALYPYDETAVRTETGLEVTFPSEQNVSSVGFDADACVAAAYTDEFEDGIRFALEELYSCFKFSVDAEDKVVQVTLSAVAGEYLAGMVEVAFSDDEPVMKVLEGSGSVTFRSSSPMDGTYVICLLPAVLQEGIAATLTAEDGSVAEKTIKAKNDAGNDVALELVRGRMNNDPVVFADLFASEAPDTPDPDVPDTPVDPDPVDPDTPVGPDPDDPVDPEPVIVWVNGNIGSYVLNDILDLWI